MIKIFIIASEESGSTIGSLLMNKLKVEFSSNVSFYGIGGQKMINEGLNITTPMSKISVMGIVEVVKHMNTIVNTIFSTEKHIREIQPDIVIAIDSQDFSKRIFAKIKDLSSIKIQYVAPSVWAWRQGRAKSLKGIVDYLFTLFPFENKFFEKEGIKTYCVGHGIIENDFLIKNNIDNFKEKFNITNNEKIITLLPGSRMSEITKHLPIMIESLKLLKQQEQSFRFFIPTTEITQKHIKKIINSIQESIRPILIENEQDKFSLFKISNLAIAASGTVTLELGISKTPSIIIYKVNPITAFIVKKMIKIKKIGLINILMNKEIYPELLQNDATPSNINSHALKIINDPKTLEKMKTSLSEFKNYMINENKNLSPSTYAAKIIKEITEKKSSICDKGDDL